MYRFQDIAAGATVQCTDGVLGIVESLDHDAVHGYVTHLLIRSELEAGAAAQLTRAPVQLVTEVPTPKRVILGCTIAEAVGAVEGIPLKQREAGDEA